MTIHNQLPVTYFSNFFVLTNLLEGESQIQQETVSWWPHLYSKPAWIFPSLLAPGLLRNSIIENAVISVQVPNLSFFSERGGRENWSSHIKPRMKGWTAAVRLAIKNIPAWDPSPQVRRTRKQTPRSGPGHRSAAPTETKARLTTALAGQMKTWAQSGGKSEFRSGSLLSFGAPRRIQKSPLIFFFFSFKKLPLHFMQQ